MHSSRMRTVCCSGHLPGVGGVCLGAGLSGGCLPSGVSAQGGVCPGGCLPGDGLAQGVSARGGGVCPLL